MRGTRQAEGRRRRCGDPRDPVFVVVRVLTVDSWGPWEEGWLHSRLGLLLVGLLHARAQWLWLGSMGGPVFLLPFVRIESPWVLLPLLLLLLLLSGRRE